MHLQILHECTFVAMFHSNVSSMIKWHPERRLPSMLKHIDQGGATKASSVYVLFGHQDIKLDRKDWMRNLPRSLISNLLLGKIPEIAVNMSISYPVMYLVNQGLIKIKYKGK